MTTPPLSSSSTSEDSMATKITTTFKNDIIKEALKCHFSNPKTKINDDAVNLMTDLSKTLVLESALRAAKQASVQNKSAVTLDHMESVLPQLMLDFP